MSLGTLSASTDLYRLLLEIMNILTKKRRGHKYSDYYLKFCMSVHYAAKTGGYAAMQGHWNKNGTRWTGGFPLVSMKRLYEIRSSKCLQPGWECSKFLIKDFLTKLQEKHAKVRLI